MRIRIRGGVPNLVDDIGLRTTLGQARHDSEGETTMRRSHGS
jgi:hypothetical protein